MVVGTSLRNQASALAAAAGAKASKDRLRVLVCAPSNTAVDEIVYRLKTQGVLGVDGECPIFLPFFPFSLC